MKVELTKYLWGSVVALALLSCEEVTSVTAIDSREPQSSSAFTGEIAELGSGIKTQIIIAIGPGALSGGFGSPLASGYPKIQQYFPESKIPGWATIVSGQITKIQFNTRSRRLVFMFADGVIVSRFYMEAEERVILALGCRTLLFSEWDKSLHAIKEGCLKEEDA